MLSVLGLDQETECVYKAMLMHPAEGVAELCERLRMPEQGVRNALDKLSELALVRASHESPGRLTAISPEVGMEMMLTRQQAELAVQQQRLEASRAAAAALVAEYAHLRPVTTASGVERLTGIDAIRERLYRLHREVREEVMIFSPDGEQTVENLAAARPLDEALLARGVRMRTVYLDSVRNSAHTVEYAQRLSELGRQARTAATLPTRMILVDRVTAVVPVDADDTAAGALVLTDSGMLTALCALFESVWAGAAPFGGAVSRDDRGLTSTESAAVRLLAEGHTDEAIAKRLGVSHRTARRIAGGLMERLGARSRFEAGVAAVRRGWL
jgi:DNA-binding NarL/FixJ family response regulator